MNIIKQLAFLCSRYGVEISILGVEDDAKQGLCYKLHIKHSQSGVGTFYTACESDKYFYKFIIDWVHDFGLAFEDPSGRYHDYI